MVLKLINIILFITLVSIIISSQLPTRELTIFINQDDYINTISTEEHRKPVAIIDTGLQFQLKEFNPYLCLGGHKDFTGEGLQDKIGHGTNVAWNVINGVDYSKYCLLIIKWYGKHNNDEQATYNITKSLNWAYKQNPILINISGGGLDPIRQEREILEVILSKNNTLVVVAAGNYGWNLEKHCDFYPACYFNNQYMNLHVVGAWDFENHNKASFSNYGSPPITDWANGIRVSGPRGKLIMTGTSQATALISNSILKSLK